MKNQYFGDINDYRKYGLLRCIAETSRLSIGVCWMLTEDDVSGDGQDRGYLHNPAKYKNFDPDLFNNFAPFADMDEAWTVENAELWEVLPGAEYFDTRLPYQGPKREQYFIEVSKSLSGCPVIFLDPDNGIAPPSAQYGRSGSDKWLFWREIRSLYSEGHSLVIYQHFPRRPRDEFINELTLLFQANLDPSLGVPSVMAYRTSNVVFFLVTHPEHVEHLAGLKDLIQARWHGELTHVAMAPEAIDPEEVVECFDCGLNDRRDSEIYGGNGKYYCRHFSPDYWVRHGYERNWGDAAVMNWPLMEILRRETTDRCEFVILAPQSTRGPVILHSSDPEAGGMY